MQVYFTLDNDKKLYKRNVQAIDINNAKYVFRLRDNGFTIINSKTMEVLVNKNINLSENAEEE